MVIKMTNRLLAVVIAIALSSGIAAHAAQSPERPLTPVLPTASTLPAATSLPTTLQTAASRLGETLTSSVDPKAAIRGAYQRDRVALERLRQQGSGLQGSAHPAFNQFISDQVSALTSLERDALATTTPSAGSAIKAMDDLVAAAQAELTRQLQSNAKKSPTIDQGDSAGKSNDKNN
jgi:hypothetical protein